MVALVPQGLAASSALRLIAPQRQVVGRSRLLAQLDLDRVVPMLVIGAPAGFGKTTLVQEWLSVRPPSNAQAIYLEVADSTDSDQLWGEIYGLVSEAVSGPGKPESVRPTLLAGSATWFATWDRFAT